MTTNRHGVAAFDFATASGCGQVVIGPTHTRGGTLDLLITIVPDLVGVPVVVQLGPRITYFYGRHFVNTRCSKLVH